MYFSFFQNDDTYLANYKKPHPRRRYINLLNAELIPICNLLALLAAHRILYVSRIRVILDAYIIAINHAVVHYVTHRFTVIDIRNRN